MLIDFSTNDCGGVINNTVTSIRTSDTVSIQIEQKSPSLNKFSVILNDVTILKDITIGPHITVRRLDQKRKSFRIMDPSMFVAVLLLFTMFSPLCMACVFCLYRKRKSSEKNNLPRFGPWTLSHSRHSILETNILYRQPIEFRTPQTEEEWLIPSEDVSVGAVIGEGAFGLVCKGTMSGPKGMAVRVAIKQLKANAIDEEREEFLREMDIMKQAC
ncbi:hypothetical protein DICVIV_01247 [Dictyocaulus viviparus]|uniref:Protein kinase domain-containing protein n=1 Tax=Dictyocaulus viviparus TaxID=29172 RepID=A0A0D8Y8K1_DICVI|nr:hypothetical protein DICVIV_01247 [Dictyocaulus viviparus]